jgi:hypothetical protein
MPDLNKEEQALLAKLGFTENKIKNLLKPHRTKKDVVPLTNLVGTSGIIVMKCVCCGKTTESFVDYVKRTDTEGFTIKVVSAPSNAPTRQHDSIVYSCPNCADGELESFSKIDLATMVINLRKELRKGVKR